MLLVHGAAASRGLRPRGRRRRDARPPGQIVAGGRRPCRRSLHSREDTSRAARRAAPFSGRAPRGRAGSSTASTTRSRASSTSSAPSGTCASTSSSRWSCCRSVSLLGVSRIEMLALILAVGVRDRHRDVEHRARDGDRRRHDLVRPARHGRQGHRRRRGAGRGGDRAVGRLPGVRAPPAESEPSAAINTRARLAGAPHGDRDGRRDPARDRDQGATSAPARRCGAGCRPAMRPSRSAAGRRSRSSPTATRTRCWSRPSRS